jgi:DNA-binding PadR family transcriptional regulator
MTYVTGLVLQAIHHGYRYGFEIMDASGLADGTVYPALRRLEAGGLLVSDWEDAAAARAAKRPARRYYELTAAGERALRQAQERFRGLAVAMMGAAGTVESLS